MISPEELSQELLQAVLTRDEKRVQALVVTKAISGLLYGITATDTSTFVVVALLFAAVAFVATYFPARRAAKIDPTIAFRSE